METQVKVSIHAWSQQVANHYGCLDKKLVIYITASGCAKRYLIVCFRDKTCMLLCAAPYELIELDPRLSKMSVGKIDSIV